MSLYSTQVEFRKLPAGAGARNAHNRDGDDASKLKAPTTLLQCRVQSTKYAPRLPTPTSPAVAACNVSLNQAPPLCCQITFEVPCLPPWPHVMLSPLPHASYNSMGAPLDCMPTPAAASNRLSILVWTMTKGTVSLTAAAAAASSDKRLIGTPRSAPPHTTMDGGAFLAQLSDRSGASGCPFLDGKAGKKSSVGSSIGDDTRSVSDSEAPALEKSALRKRNGASQRKANVNTTFASDSGDSGM